MFNLKIGALSKTTSVKAKMAHLTATQNLKLTLVESSILEKFWLFEEYAVKQRGQTSQHSYDNIVLAKRRRAF